ncbi:hypothetical protein [Thiosocius teredinicola]|uniref:hypothetical protein n=1 Tax=Thiosocius teredinicola TaxID=1973002 RepID=UPI0009913AC2
MDTNPIHSMKIVAISLACALSFLTGCDNPANNATPANDPRMPASSAAMLDPCSIISGTDAESILGEPVQPAQTSENPAVGAKLCMYNPVSEGSTRFLQISLTQDAAMRSSSSTATSIFRSLKSGFDGSRTDIDGLGDEAFIATGGLHLLKDGYYVNIGAGNTNSDAVRSQLLAAGELAAQRL